MVHSSLSSIGNVVGGPHSVICGLKQVMGPDATLLMPAYAMKGNMYETMINPAPFDVKKSRSTMGAITEAFRTMPDVFRSAHPTHSVCASGPKAKEYTEKHHLSRSPCGPGSPFQLLSQCHGYILCIGSGIGKITFHHIIEDKVDYFPERVYLPEMHKKRVIFHDGHSEEIEVLVHDPALGSRRVDADAGKEDEILEEMRRRGIVHEGLIGQAKCHLINAESLEDMLLDLLRKGVTIYRNKKEASI
jgi:aminoglycoside 3-N-acetyltransferase